MNGGPRMEHYVGSKRKEKFSFVHFFCILKEYEHDDGFVNVHHGNGFIYATVVVVAAA